MLRNIVQQITTYIFNFHKLFKVTFYFMKITLKFQIYRYSYNSLCYAPLIIFALRNYMYFKGIKKKCHYVYHHIDNSQCSLLIKDPGFYLVPRVLNLQGIISLVNFFYYGHTLSGFCLAKMFTLVKKNTPYEILKESTQIYFQVVTWLLLLNDFAGYIILYWEIFLSYWKIFLSTF